VNDIDKIEIEDEIVDLDNNNENEAPSDMNTQEYPYNEKASDDANFSSNLLRSNVTSEQQQSRALDVMKYLDRKIVEAAGDTNEWNCKSENQNDNDNQNGNGNQNTDESEGMEATTDSDNIDRWPEYCDPNYRMPGMITVRVTLDLEERRFQVNIIKAVKCSKIYLGRPSFLCLFSSLVSSLPFLPSIQRYVIHFCLLVFFLNFHLIFCILVTTNLIQMSAIVLNIILHYLLLSLHSPFFITRLISQLNGIKLGNSWQDPYPIILHSRLHF
jgi:hypothetical protein